LLLDAAINPLNPRSTHLAIKMIKAGSSKVRPGSRSLRIECHRPAQNASALCAAVLAAGGELLRERVDRAMGA